MSEKYYKYKRYRMTDDNDYLLVSQWSNCNSVEMEDGRMLAQAYGSEDITEIGDGTLTGAIKYLSSLDPEKVSNLESLVGNADISSVGPTVTQAIVNLNNAEHDALNPYNVEFSGNLPESEGFVNIYENKDDLTSPYLKLHPDEVDYRFSNDGYTQVVGRLPSYRIHKLNNMIADDTSVQISARGNDQELFVGATFTTTADAVWHTLELSTDGLHFERNNPAGGGQVQIFVTRDEFANLMGLHEPVQAKLDDLTAQVESKMSGSPVAVIRHDYPQSSPSGGVVELYRDTNLIDPATMLSWDQGLSIADPYDIEQKSSTVHYTVTDYYHLRKLNQLVDNYADEDDTFVQITRDYMGGRHVQLRMSNMAENTSSSYGSDGIYIDDGEGITVGLDTLSLKQLEGLTTDPDVSELKLIEPTVIDPQSVTPLKLRVATTVPFDQSAADYSSKGIIYYADDGSTIKYDISADQLGQLCGIDYNIGEEIARIWAEIGNINEQIIEIRKLTDHLAIIVDEPGPTPPTPDTVPVPVVTTTAYTYTGSEVELVFDSIDLENVDVIGNTATDVGNYTCTCSLKDEGDMWEDGTTSPKTYLWYIRSEQVTIPTVSDVSKIYNGTAQSPTIVNFDSERSTQSGVVTATDAGRYTVTFSLIDPVNTTWSDSTTNDKTFIWSIARKQIYMPNVTNTSLTYTGLQQGPTIDAYDATIIHVSGTLQATGVNPSGTPYQIDFDLRNTTNYVWSDGSTATKHVSWNIVAKKIAVPTVDPLSFNYNGSEQGPTISAFSANEIIQSGTDRATNAGEYSIVFKLVDGTNTAWTDSTTADKTILWEIINNTVEVPTVTGTSKTYSGSVQGPTIGAYDASKIRQSGTTTATNAGEYTITFSLIDPSVYTWEDLTTADKTVTWTISPKIYHKPVVTETTLIYTGSEQGPNFSCDTAIVSVGGDVTKVHGNDNYVLTFTLIDSTNWSWQDGTSDPYNVSWKILPKSVSQPNVTNTELEYNGSEQGPTISEFDTNAIIQSGIDRATSVGNYQIKFSLTSSTDYKWYDNTTGTKTVDWSIGSATIPIPVVTDTTQTYNMGNPVGPTITWDSSYLSKGMVTRSGDLTATDPGSYSITYTIVDRTSAKWSDNTTGPKTFNWTIAKMQDELSLSRNSIAVFDTEPGEVVLTIPSKRGVSMTGYDSSLVSINIGNSYTPIGQPDARTITITGKGVTGETSVTFSTQTDAYFIGGSITLTIWCFQNVVRWSTATDDEIAAVVQAADAGSIDLYADMGWRVGDERTVSLDSIASSGTFDGVTWSISNINTSPAQTATLVLMDAGKTSETGTTLNSTAASRYELNTAVKNKDGSNRSNPAFLVGLKNCLSNGSGPFAIRMNNSATSEGSYGSSAAAAWLDGGFRGSLPTAIRSIFKKMKVQTLSSYNGDTLQVTPCYFSFWAEKEVFGTKTYSGTSEDLELRHVEWYKTESNRDKSSGTNTKYAWYLRSLYAGVAGYFIDVQNTTPASPMYVAANTVHGVAPFGAI